ncbi:MAG: HAD-IC family P-type ATPase [Patescibacteria group bacterium]|nr:HAD-IC family P-type ATPase [Patescibacteria group bacterium]
MKNIIFEEKEILPLRLFLEQFKSPFIYILIFACLLTLLFKEYTDTLVIFSVILINSLLGFIQEYKAQNTLYHLRKLLKPRTIVIRNSKREEIDSENIVVGDTVILSKEFSIPADGKIIEEENLSINEAIITGESVPLMKRDGDEIFAGTTILNGIGKMKVTGIGSQTRVGKIGKYVLKQEDAKTPLQKQTTRLAKSLSVVVVLLVLFLFVVGLIGGYGTKEILYTAIAVAVAAIPEGLIITLTVILALGMKKILKRKAIVSKLISAETLGSVTVICADKTGTITEGKLTVVEQNFINKEFGQYSALLCNNQIDPLETTMMEWIYNDKDYETIQRIKKAKTYGRIDSIPFNNGNNYAATLNKFQNGNIVFAFGAPEQLIERCNIEASVKNEWIQNIQKQGIQGRKILGFAYKFVDAKKKSLSEKDIVNLEWNGILIFDDPIRKKIKLLLEECAAAGIKIKMITGDYLPTALTVAKEIGLLPKTISGSESPYILTGEDLKKMSPEELKESVDDIVVFARTDPFQKLKIVEALRENGEVVAMTGDGVNDAPALKSADIGIVVNEASDISKDVADVVLLDSNFNTIVHAIEEGRVIFDNIRKSIMYLLSDSLSEVILIIGSILLKLPLPVTAIQILWINLMEDTLPAFSLAFEPKEDDVMKRRPRPKNSQIVNKRMKVMLVVFILITDFSLLLIFRYFNSTIDDLAYVRTMIFLGLGIETVFYIYSCKSISKNIFQYNPFSNKFLNVAVIIGSGLLATAVYVPFLNTLLETKPLKLNHLVLMMGLGMFNLVVIELVKLVNRFIKESDCQQSAMIES